MEVQCPAGSATRWTVGAAGAQVVGPVCGHGTSPFAAGSCSPRTGAWDPRALTCDHRAIFFSFSMDWEDIFWTEGNLAKFMVVTVWNEW